MKVPKDYIQDCRLCDTAEEVHPAIDCDAEHNYLVIGGYDHEVGQVEPTDRSKELEDRTRECLTKAGFVDYA